MLRLPTLSKAKAREKTEVSKVQSGNVSRNNASMILWLAAMSASSANSIFGDALFFTGHPRFISKNTPLPGTSSRTGKQSDNMGHQNANRLMHGLISPIF